MRPGDAVWVEDVRDTYVTLRLVQRPRRRPPRFGVFVAHLPGRRSGNLAEAWVATACGLERVPVMCIGAA